MFKIDFKNNNSIQPIVVGCSIPHELVIKKANNKIFRRGLKERGKGRSGESWV